MSDEACATCAVGSCEMHGSEKKEGGESCAACTSGSCETHDEMKEETGSCKGGSCSSEGAPKA